MSIKNILLSYNGQPSSEAALAVALKMAEKYDARLSQALTDEENHILRRALTKLARLG